MIRALGILACVAVLSAASSISPAFSQTTDTSGSAVTVHMRNLAFDPQSTKAQVGQTVIFSNDDSVSHNVTGDGIGSSGDIGPGKSWKYTFKKAGDYHYVCTYHPGMTGEIVVSGS
jgi:plastocyanin